jgi:hypothetical protein
MQSSTGILAGYHQKEIQIRQCWSELGPIGHIVGTVEGTTQQWNYEWRRDVTSIHKCPTTYGQGRQALNAVESVLHWSFPMMES